MDLYMSVDPPVKRKMYFVKNSLKIPNRFIRI